MGESVSEEDDADDCDAESGDTVERAHAEAEKCRAAIGADAAAARQVQQRDTGASRATDIAGDAARVA